MAAANAASIDITKLASAENMQSLAESSCSRLRDTASTLQTTVGSTVSAVAAGE